MLRLCSAVLGIHLLWMLAMGTSLSFLRFFTFPMYISGLDQTCYEQISRWWLEINCWSQPSKCRGPGRLGEGQQCHGKKNRFRRWPKFQQVWGIQAKKGPEIFSCGGEVPLGYSFCLRQHNNICKESKVLNLFNQWKDFSDYQIWCQQQVEIKISLALNINRFLNYAFPRK